ncbi:N-acetylmuramoyl-L-alanine amidase family protein [Desulfotruncus alcoholivorax]|uniref:N-acetylmuramoyl-L-alanine amidase family protein n=1 Tax=Desulfotruncus alcoholivorax TaxID=265477 RepID=UPI0003F5B79F|nr:N-acetylmuramoyl-L-alanine amidase [Desulfotruncus alcoholivorax]
MRTFRIKNILVIMMVFTLVMTPRALAPATNANQAKPVKPLNSKTIAIDPGHGGYDPGAIYGNLYEKDINLKIARKLARRLEQKGARVILTRNGDYNYALVGMHGRDAKRYDFDQRIKIIQANNADIVLTIHVNSMRKSSYEGAETFYYPKSSAGKTLALSIQQELRTIPSMTKRIAKVSNCYMLRRTNVPAVLVEVGYLSNKHERELLKDPDYHDLLTQKITAGVIQYFNSPEKITNNGIVQDTTAAVEYVIRAMGNIFLNKEYQGESKQY